MRASLFSYLSYIIILSACLFTNNYQTSTVFLSFYRIQDTSIFVHLCSL
jgi:hypothetical protein